MVTYIPTYYNFSKLSNVDSGTNQEIRVPEGILSRPAAGIG